MRPAYVEAPVKKMVPAVAVNSPIPLKSDLTLKLLAVVIAQVIRRALKFKLVAEAAVIVLPEPENKTVPPVKLKALVAVFGTFKFPVYG